MKPFFADTSALLAWLRDDPRYVKRFRGSRFITGWWNLLECHYFQLGQGIAETEAARRLRQFEAVAQEADWDALKSASVFRRRMIRDGRRCSYIDAVGYAIAGRNRSRS